MCIWHDHSYIKTFQSALWQLTRATIHTIISGDVVALEPFLNCTLVSSAAVHIRALWKPL